MKGNNEGDSFSNALLKKTKKTLASGSIQMIETGSLFLIGIRLCLGPTGCTSVEQFFTGKTGSDRA
jgi:hypothetical protein